MINILPVNDIKHHVENSTCECKPKIEILEDGEIMVVHNAWDNREMNEELIEKCLTNKN